QATRQLGRSSPATELRAPPLPPSLRPRTLHAPRLIPLSRLPPRATNAEAASQGLACHPFHRLRVARASTRAVARSSHAPVRTPTSTARCFATLESPLALVPLSICCSSCTA